MEHTLASSWNHGRISGDVHSAGHSRRIELMFYVIRDTYEICRAWGGGRDSWGQGLGNAMLNKTKNKKTTATATKKTRFQRISSICISL